MPEHITTLTDAATKLVDVHKTFKDAGMSENLVHELTATFARGYANGSCDLS